MSVHLGRVASLEPPESTALTTTNATTVHTASTNFKRVVETITIANTDTANNCECTLTWVDVTPTSYTFWRKDIVAGTTEVLDNIPIITDGNGTVRLIQATAENANDLTITVITSASSRVEQHIRGGIGD